jgi:hypothetical protein
VQRERRQLVEYRSQLRRAVDYCPHRVVGDSAVGKHYSQLQSFYPQLQQDTTRNHVLKARRLSASCDHSCRPSFAAPTRGALLDELVPPSAGPSIDNHEIGMSFRYSPWRASPALSEENNDLAAEDCRRRLLPDAEPARALGPPHSIRE